MCCFERLCRIFSSILLRLLFFLQLLWLLALSAACVVAAAAKGLLAPTMSFSSYPGMLSSLDDFYAMHETSLAVTQTTNGLYNTSLYDVVVPEALPAWHRVRAANALAADGHSWAAILARHNSGTYNNQVFCWSLCGRVKRLILDFLFKIIISRLGSFWANAFAQVLMEPRPLL